MATSRGAACTRDTDPTALGGVAERILDQIRNHLRDPHRIGLDGTGRLDVDLEADRGIVGPGAEFLGHAPDVGTEIDRLGPSVNSRASSRDSSIRSSTSRERRRL